MLAAWDDFDEVAKHVKVEAEQFGYVLDSTRMWYGRAWRWLCALLRDDKRPARELPPKARELRRLLRLSSSDAVGRKQRAGAR